MMPGFFSVVLAMGLFNVLGSLQNIESAEAKTELKDLMRYTSDPCNYVQKMYFIDDSVGSSADD